jgi:hypothetical protein
MVDVARTFEPSSLERVIFAALDGTAFEEALRG